LRQCDSYDLRCSVGAIRFDAARHANVAAPLADADALMYAQKQRRNLPQDRG
jgi:hypothetical protein